MNIAYRIVFMLPDNAFSRAINEVRLLDKFQVLSKHNFYSFFFVKLKITGRGIRNLDVKLATNMFIIPIGGLGIAAVMLPALNAWLIMFVAG